MEVTVKKLRKPAIVYKVAPSGNSKLADRKIVSVASVAKCWRQKRLRRDLYSLRVYFPSSFLSFRHPVGEGLSICRVHSSVRSSGQMLLPRYLMNSLNSIEETYWEYSLIPTDDLVRLWRSNVKGQGHRRPSRW